MEYEYYPSKSKVNKEKHGIDFIAAQALWDDPDALEIPLVVDDEPRSLVFGVIQGKHWCAIITRRNEKIRIISVRRARDKERALYEG